MGDTTEHFIEQSDHELNHYKIMHLMEKNIPKPHLYRVMSPKISFCFMEFSEYWFAAEIKMTRKLVHIHAEVTRHCLLEAYEVPPLPLGNSQTKSLYVEKSEKPGIYRNIYIMVYRGSRLGVCMES